MFLNLKKICLGFQPNVWQMCVKNGNRCVHSSAIVYGKRNFRKFPIPNKRGQFEHVKLPKELMENEFDYPISRDTLLVRYPGYYFRRNFIYVKEMEPELVVPDLTGFELKPYVSYRCPDITQSEFTARDLFNATQADNIIEKFKNEENIDLSVNEEDIEKARIRAKQTGSDLFFDKLELVIE